MKSRNGKLDQHKELGLGFYRRSMIFQYQKDDLGSHKLEEVEQ